MPAMRARECEEQIVIVFVAPLMIRPFVLTGSTRELPRARRAPRLQSIHERGTVHPCQILAPRRRGQARENLNSPSSAARRRAPAAPNCAGTKQTGSKAIDATFVLRNDFRNPSRGSNSRRFGDFVSIRRAIFADCPWAAEKIMPPSSLQHWVNDRVPRLTFEGRRHAPRGASSSQPNSSLRPAARDDYHLGGIMYNGERRIFRHEACRNLADWSLGLRHEPKG